METKLGEAAPPAEESRGDVVVTRDDRAQATLEKREKSMEDLAAQLSAELEEANKNIESTIRSWKSAASGKPSKRQMAVALERMLKLVEAMNKSDTVIRNFLYNNVLGAQLQIRALRRVLDSRLGAPITDDELKGAREAILAEDQKLVSEKHSAKAKDELAAAVESAQEGAAKNE